MPLRRSKHNEHRLAMFNRCSDVTITGGTFNVNITNSVSSSALDDEFRSIRVGDINLLSCIGENELVEYHVVQRKKHSGIVRVSTGRRRIHHARIFPSPDVFTVFEYEGSDFAKCKTVAEEQQCVRHPHLVQLFGVTNSRSMNALIYHDELLPITDALSRCTSSLSSKCLNYTMTYQYWSFVEYWNRRTGEYLDVRHYVEHADWFRASTGQLCVEVGVNCDSKPYPFSRTTTIALDMPAAWNSMSDTELVNRMNIRDILKIFNDATWAWKAISLHHGQVHLGALYSFHDRLNPYVPMVELLRLPATADLCLGNWRSMDSEKDIPVKSYVSEKTGATSWTRIDLHQLYDSDLRNNRSSSQVSHVTRVVKFLDAADIESRWLAQANHFLPEHLSNEYFLATAASFDVTIWYPTDDVGLRGTFMADAPMKDLYLFLFNPHVSIQDGVVSVEIPALQDAYYWSFRRDGREPIAPEILDGLVPPQVHLNVSVWGKYWSKQDYQLIRDITRAKGLDAESCDLAAQLGYPPAIMHDAPLAAPLYANTTLPEFNTFQQCSAFCGFCKDLIQHTSGARPKALPAFALLIVLPAQYELCAWRVAAYAAGRVFPLQLVEDFQFSCEKFSETAFSCHAGAWDTFELEREIFELSARSRIPKLISVRVEPLLYRTIALSESLTKPEGQRLERYSNFTRDTLLHIAEAKPAVHNLLMHWVPAADAITMLCVCRGVKKLPWIIVQDSLEDLVPRILDQDLQLTRLHCHVLALFPPKQLTIQQKETRNNNTTCLKVMSKANFHMTSQARGSIIVVLPLQFEKTQ
ncbi:hypothetical protein GGX14DRAFT_676254 [Mycena pura]|uniref:Uncharacterized protein n=1 Tax=Mycena pura TaxID=153505 RepID=A0AAD6YGZ0_9AGAR|nr:hypothetical protein GGX14DRAFT_676254 [Mycena pura]